MGSLHRMGKSASGLAVQSGMALRPCAIQHRERSAWNRLGGILAPCTACSISQVTSIAQSSSGSWYADGSEFGIDSGGNNAIQWLQVAFGNWDTDCAAGTTLCTLHVSADPTVYYGGSQAYPNASVAGSNFNPTGYGPYETIDGVQAYGGLSSQRRADIAISEPLPPAPCTVDASGLCALQTSRIQKVLVTLKCGAEDSNSSFRYPKHITPIRCMQYIVETISSKSPQRRPQKPKRLRNYVDFLAAG